MPSPMNGGRQYYCRGCNSEKSREMYARKERLVFDYYGRICACCGETERLFLSIDHKKNDGHEERWPSGGRVTGKLLYQKIVAKNYPDTYQVLCMNCNWGKRMNNGVCPHLKQ